MEQSIILTKESSEEEIKAYFQKVLELKQSNKEFPVNLDEVWPLVYQRKQKALDILKSEFIEGDDYYLTQTGKVVEHSKLTNGVKIDAWLSVSCMEYFIARKVRRVFDVYRQVFHNTVESARPLSQLEILVQSAQTLLDQERRINAIETKVSEIEAKTTTRPEYFTIAGYGAFHKIPVNLIQASSLGRKASSLCKQRGIPTETIPDPRFGIVKTYPMLILDEVFSTPIN